MDWPPGNRSETDCASTLRIVSVNDEFLALEYTWDYEGKTERGSMIVATSERRNETTIGWSDSWHQNSAVMLLVGPSIDKVSCKGTYHVHGMPDWHWRIELEPLGDEFLFRMFNISPEGNEELAVDGRYTRVSDP